MKCCKCAKEILDNSQFCNHCGSLQESEPEKTVNMGRSEIQDTNIVNSKNVNHTLSHKKRWIIGGVVSVLVIASAIAIPKINVEMKYKKAVSLMDTGKYQDAISIFSSIKENKEKAILDYCMDYVTALCQKEDYDTADNIIDSVSQNELLNETEQKQLSDYADYTTAASLENSGNYTDAYYQYIRLGDYEDSIEKADALFENHKADFYELAIANFKSNIKANILLAKSQFEKLDKYEDSEMYLNKISFLNDLKGTYLYQFSVGGQKPSQEERYVIDYDNVKFYDGTKDTLSSNVTVVEIDGKLYAFCNLYDNKKSGEIFSVENGKVHFQYADVYEDGTYHIDTTFTTNKILKKTTDEVQSISKPIIGMTAEEVENSTWGKPKKINKTTTASGISEQWVYSASRYVYLDDGIVTGIQE